jgi:peptidoglycan/LPS O-acetylase OafA/YrhL
MKQQSSLGMVDLLRGLAAVAVVLYHYSLLMGEMRDFSTPAMLPLFLRGSLGVHVFFVISGFVIPLSLARSGYTLAGFGAYIRRRLVRLAPPAYVSILLILLQWAAADVLVHHRLQLLAGLSWGGLMSNVLFIVPFTPYSWINGVFWTLTVEFEFYLLLGLLYPLLFGNGRLWLFLLLYLLLLAASYAPGLYVQNYLHYSTLFAMGGLTMRYYEQRMHLVPYLGCLALFAGLTWFALGHERMMAGVTTALLIAFVRTGHPVSRFLGSISYSIYLTHVAVGSVANFVLGRVLHPSADWQRIAVVLGCVGLSIGVATLFNRWVEQPSQRLARRISTP